MALSDMNRLTTAWKGEGVNLSGCGVETCDAAGRVFAEPEVAVRAGRDTGRRRGRRQSNRSNRAPVVDSREAVIGRQPYDASGPDGNATRVIRASRNPNPVRIELLVLADQ